MGNFPGFFQADYGRVGGLLHGDVLAGGLAKLFAGLGDVENVVDHLEGEADVVTEVSKGGELGGGAVGRPY